MTLHLLSFIHREFNIQIEQASRSFAICQLTIISPCTVQQFLPLFGKLVPFGEQQISLFLDNFSGRTARIRGH